MNTATNGREKNTLAALEPLRPAQPVAPPIKPGRDSRKKPPPRQERKKPERQIDDSENQDHGIDEYA